MKLKRVPLWGAIFIFVCLIVVWITTGDFVFGIVAGVNFVFIIIAIIKVFINYSNEQVVDKLTKEEKEAMATYEILKKYQITYVSSDTDYLPKGSYIAEIIDVSPVFSDLKREHFLGIQVTYVVFNTFKEKIGTAISLFIYTMSSISRSYEVEMSNMRKTNRVLKSFFRASGLLATVNSLKEFETKDFDTFTEKAYDNFKSLFAFLLSTPSSFIGKTLYITVKPDRREHVNRVINAARGYKSANLGSKLPSLPRL